MLLRSVHSRSEPRQGVVLIAVLMVIVVLTLAAYEFSELMQAEYRAAISHRKSLQAHAAAESGVYYAAAVLSNPDSMSSALANNPFDNASAFNGVPIGTDTGTTGQVRFSVVSPVDVDSASVGGETFRYGVVDESGKVNLNALIKLDSSGEIARNVLLKLPNMTEDIANAIIDWIDSNDEPQSGGAEGEYYGTLQPAYRPKNGPLDSLEELLLVRGVSQPLLWGNDNNRNGFIDANEDDGTGFADRGWSAYLTVFSRERNVSADGRARIYLNDANLQTLMTTLTAEVGEELATFIVAYRLYGAAQSGGTAQQGGFSRTRSAGASGSTGGASSGASASGGTAASGSTGANFTRGRRASSSSTGSTGAQGGRLTSSMLDLSKQPSSIASVFDLVNAQVTIPSSGSGGVTGGASGGGGNFRGGSSGGNFGRGGRGGQSSSTTGTTSTSSTFTSPLSGTAALRQYLPILLDRLTTVRDPEVPARVNVNTAPQAVIASLPGLTESDVQNILEKRPPMGTIDPADPTYQTIAWLVTEANINPQTLRTVERYVTARSQVYRIQVVGYLDNGGPTARVEAVIDTNSGRPRVTYFRDLSELGKGYDVQASTTTDVIAP